MESARELVFKINNAIINPLITLLIAVALVYFLWGLFLFVRNSEDVAGKAEGKRKIVWGIIGFTIMVSVFGILTILMNTFGITAPADSGL